MFEIISVASIDRSNDGFDLVTESIFNNGNYEDVADHLARENVHSKVGITNLEQCRVNVTPLKIVFQNTIDDDEFHFRDSYLFGNSEGQDLLIIVCLKITRGDLRRTISKEVLKKIMDECCAGDWYSFNDVYDVRCSKCTYIRKSCTQESPCWRLEDALALREVAEKRNAYECRIFPLTVLNGLSNNGQVKEMK